ncbi:four helix bundle protein [Candidatus Peregrinibacteria bacterium]|jgi:four helix bundle protein|nr:four helix bundle protein [Candidatus Peregrinibacteria bacterium]
MFDFEKFPVYQKAELQYSKVLKILSNSTIDKNLKDQLKRASLSIVLNIAEGAGKFSKNDKKNFYVISKGSVNECVAIIRILKIEKLITDKLFDNIYADLLEIAKMLSGLINTMLKR